MATAVAMLPVTVSTAAAGTAPPVTDLGTLGGTTSEAYGVSGDVIVGYSDIEGDVARHAFTYDLVTGVMSDLGTLGGTNSWGLAVSGDTVVGVSQTSGNAATHAFALDLNTGEMTDLGTLGGTASEAHAVSGNIVVGQSYIDLENRVFHAFAYDLSTGEMKDLGTLGGRDSDAFGVSGNSVVGYSLTTNQEARHAFAYDLVTGVMSDLGTLGGAHSAASGVSGSIVVGNSDTTGNATWHAFAYDLTTGLMTDLGTLGGHSAASDVSGDIVVGWSSHTADAASHAFAYNLNTGIMTDLGTLGGIASEARAVSGDVVVGSSLTTDSLAWHATAWRLSGSDTVPPALTLDKAATQPSATNTLPLHFTATFDEEVTGLDSSDVTLAGTAEHGQAAVAVSSPDGQVFDIAVSGLSSDGTVTVAMGSAAVTDLAGNANTTGATSPEVLYDSTKPVVTILTPAVGAVFALGESATADYACLDAGGSGLVGGDCLTWDLPDGAVLPTDTPGSHTLTVTATDNAGNTTTVARDYTVFASFGDNSGRLESQPVWNSSIKAGATVPVRFNLGEDYGTQTFATGSPHWKQVKCPSDGATDPGTPTEVTGESGLNYDPATSEYNYRWKTDRAWTGQCWQLSMTFNNSVGSYAGATMLFNFQFDR